MKRKKIKSKTKLSEMYSKYGAGALRDRANKSGHKYWTFCDQCDSETPALRDMSCLMCGSTSDRGLRRNSKSFQGGTLLTSEDGGIDRFRLASIKHGLKARKIGMFITRGATTAKLMAMLGQYTGVKYKRTDLDKAIADAQRLLDADVNLKMQRDLAKGLTDNRGLRRNAGSKSNCDMVTDTDWEEKENTLVFEKNLSPVCVGQKVQSRESYIVTGGRAPHKPSSSGRVYVKQVGGDKWGREFFPTVFKMKWIPSYNLYPVDKVSGQARLKINSNRGLCRNSAPDSDSIKKLIVDLASDFAPVVKDIESSPYPTTQNNYGRYMSLINTMSKGDKRKSEIIAMALITAGANPSGVKSALRVMFGG